MANHLEIKGPDEQGLFTIHLHWLANATLFVSMVNATIRTDRQVVIADRTFGEIQRLPPDSKHLHAVGGTFLAREIKPE